MTKSSLVLPVLTVATVAIAACGGSSGSSTTTTPAPAPASSASSAPAAAARPATGGLPSGVTTAMVTMGDSLFHASSCVRCHGPDAKGRQNGPDLTSGHFMHLPTGSYNEIVTIITNGVPADSIKDPSHRLPMRGRGGANLTDDQIKAIAAYVYKLSHS
ncbi:MAG TPA: c-type cytochrome [Gemmatimonadaceae bacterium]|jgi:mono/diheme cytochrome c family protein|nr:c-type cytochrome [Gemmatimonadaceae bacterium]